MPFNIVFGDDFDRSDNHEWCRQLWASLKDGAVWAIPRSGLIFQRQDGKLVLHMTMPWMPEMKEKGITPEQLQQQQDSDFNATVENFGAVGVKVERGLS